MAHVLSCVGAYERQVYVAWIGSGDGVQNQCARDEVTLATSPYGDVSDTCRCKSSSIPTIFIDLCEAYRSLYSWMNNANDATLFLQGGVKSRYAVRPIRTSWTHQCATRLSAKWTQNCVLRPMPMKKTMCLLIIILATTTRSCARRAVTRRDVYTRELCQASIPESSILLNSPRTC